MLHKFRRGLYVSSLSTGVKSSLNPSIGSERALKTKVIYLDETEQRIHAFATALNPES